jgi:hypothetical protein
MLELVQNYQNILVAISISALSGLSIRVMLTLVKQKWASTYHHTMSYTLLPVITFTITTVITGNIALSLGMIGALSIVRFRNPVKNPFELVVFFALITIGISMSVNLIIGVMLVIVINSIIALSYLIEKVMRYFNVNVFSLSFEEGVEKSTLEVTSRERILALDESKFLLQVVESLDNNIVHYRIASRDKNVITNIRNSLQKNPSVLEIELRII